MKIIPGKDDPGANEGTIRIKNTDCLPHQIRFKRRRHAAKIYNICHTANREPYRSISKRQAPFHFGRPARSLSFPYNTDIQSTN